MATQSLSTSIKTFSIFLISVIILSQDKVQGRQQLVYYIHDVADGPNATDVSIVEGISAFDDSVTLLENQNFVVVGKAQGLFRSRGLLNRGATSFEDFNVFSLISIVFTNSEYGGSTLELRGTSYLFKVSQQVSQEISVVGGTGRFRFAKGYALFEIFYYDDNAPGFSIIRLVIMLE